jgi:hypothetical protein
MYLYETAAAAERIHFFYHTAVAQPVGLHLYLKLDLS